jgi:hypothetical protein
MVIYDSVGAMILILKTHPVLHGSEIVADVQIAGWLDSG